MSETRPLSAREAAEALGVSDRTIRRAILDGKLNATKAGRSFLIDPLALERFRASEGQQAVPGSDTPRAPVSLIGRERELANLLELLRQPEVRIVSAIGPGGVGKTSLARAIEMALEPDMPDGTLFVSLATIAGPEDLPEAIVTAAAIQVGQRSLDEAIDDWLSGKSLLLVLDNFEHILPAACQVERLVRTHPGAIVLITSREPLDIGGEVTVELEPLALPRADMALTDVRTAPAAVRLYVQRVREGNPAYLPVGSDLAAVGALVARLDGLPLAIELAAARASGFEPRALLDQLGAQTFPAHEDARVGPDDRHRTLSNVIRWSYDLLDLEAKRVLRWLSLAPAGVSADVARLIVDQSVPSPFDFALSIDPPVPIAPALEQLARKQLIKRDGANRWVLLETTRAFALTLFENTAERRAALDRLATIYEALAHRFWLDEMSDRQVPWIERMSFELENVRSLTRWAMDEGDGERVIRLVGPQMLFWQNRGRFAEAADYLGDALRDSRLDDQTASLGRVAYGYHLRSIGEQARANAVWEAMLSDRANTLDPRIEVIAREQLVDELQDEGRLAEAETHGRAALALAQSTGDPGLVGIAMHALGMTVWMSGDLAGGIDMLRAGLALTEGTGDNRRIARVHNNLGFALRMQGDFASARDHYRLSLDAYQVASERNMVSVTLSNLADLALLQDDFHAAIDYATQSIEVAREAGAHRLSGVAMLNRAIAQFRLGERGLAFEGFNEALPALVRMGKALIVAEALELYGQFLVDCNIHESAVAAFGAAHAIWKQAGASLDAETQRGSAAAIGTARTAIGAGEFDRLWDRGEATEIEDVLRHLRFATIALATNGPALESSGLSERERAVLRLVAEGLTDREIGEVLFVSPRTVATHVARILDKLGVESRTAAATLAVRRGYIA